ncbi:pentatricopeptide repeat-containing protein At5g11310, mitochondrial [Telopea speciosissima]|uniref:pentatricopeptide repeat-containing protein At5g11310, mitochondrial n=1 Tax=Telopea speciosissima TaxID=54955 RepID=UPI001CC66212|nr:pentatricopeptide repeat-containing protein At5g11310, mitochondrial [Telopea speciosissima]
MVLLVRLLAFTLSLRTRDHSLALVPAHRLFSHQSWLSVPGNPIIKWPVQVQSQPEVHPPPSSFPQQADEEEEEGEAAQNPTNLFQRDCATICDLLRDHTLSGPTLEAALDRTSIKPCPTLLQTIFHHFDSSPKPLFTVFLWAQKQPSFHSTPPLFNSMIDILAKARLFDLAWSLLLDRLRTTTETTSSLISADTFAVLIRRYSRAGMPVSAIRTFEFARSSDPSHSSSDSSLDLFEILLDSLCKEGHVRVASEYLDRRRESKSAWVPSVRVYNILLNGWFRSRKLKRAERLWEEMRRDNVYPTVVTYGTLVEGYCRMRRVEKAIELVGQMRREGIEPNAIVYNPIVDALGEAGRFKEALGMMERFLVLESGPTISTYNSLVKGFCKAGDLVGASKILKMMISRGFSPTPTTYNYFFRHFSRYGKIEEGMNLYTKMLESGYVPDRLTYHQLIKMLCEQERVGLAVQVSKEMRMRGIDLDLAVSTMLLHLLLKLHRFDEACEEFEDMLRRGIVPQYLTYRKLTEGLKKFGMAERARKLSDQMASLPHSMKLPDTYKEGDMAHELRSSIMRRAQAMSDILKTCRDPKELNNLRNSPQNAVASANRLVENIKRKANGL